MKAILVILLMVAVSFAQVNVRTVPQAHEFTSIFAGTVGAGADGIDTTSAFSPKFWEGVSTLCIESDTTGASVDLAQQSDSCLTIGIQFYCSETNAAGWGAYYNNKDTAPGGVADFTTLDTLDRAYVNVATGRHFIDLAEFTEWIWADSVHFFLIIGNGDSLTVNAAIGGQ